MATEKDRHMQSFCSTRENNVLEIQLGFSIHVIFVEIHGTTQPLTLDYIQAENWRRMDTLFCVSCILFITNVSNKAEIPKWWGHISGHY